VLATVVLVAADLNTWAAVSGSGSHSEAAMTMPSMSAKPKPTTSALMNALILANKSNDAKVQMAPSTCKQDNSTTLTCTVPAVGISGVVFQTYPSLTAMYAAYTAKVSSLNSSQFKQDFNDCDAQATYGEVGWNHLFKHTKAYSADQMTMGMVKEDQAAGRVFCTYTQGPGVHGLDPERRPSHGLRGRPGACERADLVGGVHHNIGIGGAPHEHVTPDSEARYCWPARQP